VVDYLLRAGDFTGGLNFGQVPLSVAEGEGVESESFKGGQP